MVNITMKAQTFPYLSMGPSGNWQGSINCFNLIEGKIVHRRTVTVPSMLEHVHILVNKWGLQDRSKQYKFLSNSSIAQRKI